jgi:hypothetical protein
MEQEVIPFSYEKPRTEIQSSLLETIPPKDEAVHQEAVRSVRATIPEETP